MDAIPSRHILKDAKCNDPMRIGCAWTGDIWVQSKPEELCMPCPNCGGYSFHWMDILTPLNLQPPS